MLWGGSSRIFDVMGRVILQLPSVLGLAKGRRKKTKILHTTPWSSALGYSRSVFCFVTSNCMFLGSLWGEKQQVHFGHPLLT